MRIGKNILIRIRTDSRELKCLCVVSDKKRQSDRERERAMDGERVTIGGYYGILRDGVSKSV